MTLTLAESARDLAMALTAVGVNKPDGEFDAGETSRRSGAGFPGAEPGGIDNQEARERVGQRLMDGLVPLRSNVECVVVDKIPRTPDIVELRLRPIGPPLRYRPGQYVEIQGPDSEDGAYSIANAPRRDGEIALLVSRARGSTVSRWIHGVLVAGDRVRLAGPYGTLADDPARSGPVLCLAAGSGLAPILALAEAALGSGYSDQVTLLFSARSENHLLARGLLAHWEAQYPNFRLVTTLTRSRVAGSMHGRVPDVLHEVIPDLSGHRVFIAGSPDFVEACLAAVRGEGAAEDCLHPMDWRARRSCSTAQSPAGVESRPRGGLPRSGRSAAPAAGPSGSPRILQRGGSGL